MSNDMSTGQNLMFANVTPPRAYGTAQTILSKSLSMPA